MSTFSAVKRYLQAYLAQRPLFLSLIRAKEAELFVRYLPIKQPVLDLGCGDGFFAATVFGKKKRIDVGLDVASSRQQQAHSARAYKKLVTYDGHVMPFGDRSFQTIISNCVLEHIPNIDEIMREAYRVLKPGGMFITSVMAAPWEEHLVGSMILGNSYVHWMRKKQQHFNLFTAGQWSKTFQKAGFTVEKKIGYLDEKACRLLDSAHYFSLPSLISYMIFRRWVLWAPLGRMYPVEWLTNRIVHDVDPSQSGAIFFVLTRPTTGSK